MDTFKFDIAAEKIYHYAWHEFADIIIEESKPIISGSNIAAATSRIQFLLHTLSTILKLLHPFMPFVTEEIWADAGFAAKNNKKSATGGLLMVETWPQ